MKNNKLLLVLASAVMAVCVSCGTGSNPTESPKTETPTTETATTAPATEAPTTAAPTETPTETPTEGPTEAPSTETHTHTYAEEWTIDVEPTLTTTGMAHRACSGCDSEITEEVPALSDEATWTKTVGTAATEEAEGTDVYTSKFGTINVTTAKLNHEFGAWEMTTEPTKDTVGSATRTCQNNGCTQTETVEVPVLTDTTVWTVDAENSVTATTLVSGKTVYTSQYGTVTVDEGFAAATKENAVDVNNASYVTLPKEGYASYYKVTVAAGSSYKVVLLGVARTLDTVYDVTFEEGEGTFTFDSKTYNTGDKLSTQCSNQLEISVANETEAEVTYYIFVEAKAGSSYVNPTDASGYIELTLGEDKYSVTDGNTLKYTFTAEKAGTYTVTWNGAENKDGYYIVYNGAYIGQSYVQKITGTIEAKAGDVIQFSVKNATYGVNTSGTINVTLTKEKETPAVTTETKDITMEVTSGGYKEYTYTAEADGVVTVSKTDQYVFLKQTSDGSTGSSFEYTVSKGDTISFWANYLMNGSTGEVTLTVPVEATAAAEVEYSLTIKQTASGFDTYKFTADVAGTYTITKASGYVFFSDDGESSSGSGPVSVELTAGQEYSFYARAMMADGSVTITAPAGSTKIFDDAETGGDTEEDTEEKDAHGFKLSDYGTYVNGTEKITISASGLLYTDMYYYVNAKYGDGTLYVEDATDSTYNFTFIYEEGSLTLAGTTYTKEAAAEEETETASIPASVQGTYVCESTGQVMTITADNVSVDGFDEPFLRVDTTDSNKYILDGGFFGEIYIIVNDDGSVTDDMGNVFAKQAAEEEEDATDASGLKTSWYGTYTSTSGSITISEGSLDILGSTDTTFTVSGNVITSSYGDIITISEDGTSLTDEYYGISETYTKQ